MLSFHQLLSTTAHVFSHTAAMSQVLYFFFCLPNFLICVCLHQSLGTMEGTYSPHQSLLWLPTESGLNVCCPHPVLPPWVLYLLPVLPELPLETVKVSVGAGHQLMKEQWRGPIRWSLLFLFWSFVFKNPDYSQYRTALCYFKPRM